MTNLKTLAALIALALTSTAHAADTAVSLQSEFNATRGATVLTMPAGVTLAAAQDRLRVFLIAQDSEIVRDQPGEIEARTPFAVDVEGNGSFQSHIMQSMSASDGHVWYKRRVVRVSQDAGAPVLLTWCSKTLETNVAGARVPERVSCKASFAEWKMLREVTAALSSADSESGVVAKQGPAGEVLP